MGIFDLRSGETDGRGRWRVAGIGAGALVASAVLVGGVLVGGVLGGAGQQPGNGTQRKYEHGVLTLAGLDASFLTADAKARRWQEIIKAAGQPVVEEYNRMSIVDTLLNGGWEMVDYEFAIDAAGNDVERYVLRRPK